MIKLKLPVLFLSLFAITVITGPNVSFAAGERWSRLEDVLKWSYENNPTLRAARAELKAVQEALPQAQAGFKPSIDAGGNISSVDIAGSNFGGSGTTSKEMEVGFSQPLYRGGRTLAAVDEADDQIMAQRALLRTVEQGVLLDVVTAFMNVVRDKALLDLSASNESYIAKELEATQERYDVGDLSRTDLSQAQARLARARADKISARGALQSSRAVYEQVVGVPAENLEQPVPSLPIPDTLEEAVSIAEKNNPSVIAARYMHESAEENVDKVFGELLPELAFFGSWNRQYDPQPGLLKESTTKTVGLSASIPLYQAGAVRSRVRQAKHTANQRYMEILESRRDIRAQVVSSWAELSAAKAEIQSRDAQVEASEIAREGVREEALLGARTVLDTLDADQEFLDAQAALITAQRNKIVAEFALAATLGVLKPDVLELRDFSKEFEKHLELIQWKILGVGVGEENVKAP